MPQATRTSTNLPDRVIAFDLETTGLDPATDRIVEFAFIVLDDQLIELDRWGEIVDPGIPIPRQATEVHGISNDEVHGCRPFGTVAPLVQAMVDDAVLMAYNHGFDRDFLHQELVRAGGHGLDERHPFLDPLVHFRAFVPSTPNNLGEAVRHYLGKDLEGAHRAIHDTEAMVEVFRAQWEAHPEIGSSLADALVPYRDWLDEDRKVYRDSQGVARFGFGKHENSPVADHGRYARWMLGADFQPGTKAVLRELLDA